VRVHEEGIEERLFRAAEDVEPKSTEVNELAAKLIRSCSGHCRIRPRSHLILSVILNSRATLRSKLKSGTDAGVTRRVPVCPIVGRAN